jgi:hypothetical protein
MSDDGDEVEFSIEKENESPNNLPYCKRIKIDVCISYNMADIKMLNNLELREKQEGRCYETFD